MEGAVLHAAAVAQGAHADCEARDQAEVHHRGVDVADQDADIRLGGPVGLGLPDNLQAGIELLAVAGGAAIAERQHGGGCVGGAGVANHSAHNEPARPAAERDAAADVPGARRDDGEFLIRRRPIKARLDCAAVIGHAIAQAAEIGRQHGLAVAQVFGEVGLVEIGVEDQQVIDAGRHGGPPTMRWR
jgi:hypothetical protein